MPAHTLASHPDSAAARLVIHTSGSAGKGGSLGAFILRAGRLAGLQGDDRRRAIGLEIQDGEGHRVLALDAAGLLVDVALLPGTYRVSAEQGGARRSYTVALAPGSTFDLYLRPAASP